jgi:hypothetical protein
MAVGNQFADNVTTFRINRGSEDQNDRGEGQGGGRGSLKFTGNYTPLGSPSGMVYLI